MTPFSRRLAPQQRTARKKTSIRRLRSGPMVDVVIQYCTFPGLYGSGYSVFERSPGIVISRFSVTPCRGGRQAINRCFSRLFRFCAPKISYCEQKYCPLRPFVFGFIVVVLFPAPAPASTNRRPRPAPRPPPASAARLPAQKPLPRRESPDCPPPCPAPAGRS